MGPERPISVEVLTYAPVAFFHCLHCEFVWQQAGLGQTLRHEQLESAMPEDLRRQYQELSDWVRRMLATHQGRIRFRIVDAASIEGWYKSLRYRVREYPAVIVAGKDKVIGSDFGRATELVEQRLAG